MDIEPLIRWLHVMGAVILLGTGAGIAFFMVMAHRTGQAQIVASVARIVVLADFVFTATAVIAQPITGIWLAQLVGWRLTEGWLVTSIVLYVFAGLFWLPVVRIQIQMRGLADKACSANHPLPERYHKLYRIWFLCGFPAFAAVAVIFWLMLNRPELKLL
jgi:uncharacterized membrane protein